MQITHRGETHSIGVGVIAIKVGNRIHEIDSFCGAADIDDMGMVTGVTLVTIEGQTVHLPVRHDDQSFEGQLASRLAGSVLRQRARQEMGRAA